MSCEKQMETVTQDKKGKIVGKCGILEIERLATQGVERKKPSTWKYMKAYRKENETCKLTTLQDLFPKKRMFQRKYFLAHLTDDNLAISFYLSAVQPPSTASRQR